MPKKLADHRQIGILGVQSGDGVDFHEMRAATAVGTDIDARGVAAAQRAMGGQGDALGLGHFRIVGLAARRVPAEFLPAGLVAVGINLGFGRLAAA